MGGNKNLVGNYFSIYTLSKYYMIFTYLSKVTIYNVRVNRTNSIIIIEIQKIHYAEIIFTLLVRSIIRGNPFRNHTNR